MHQDKESKIYSNRLTMHQIFHDQLHYSTVTKGSYWWENQRRSQSYKKMNLVFRRVSTRTEWRMYMKRKIQIMIIKTLSCLRKKNHLKSLSNQISSKALEIEKNQTYQFPMNSPHNSVIKLNLTTLKFINNTTMLRKRNKSLISKKCSIYKNKLSIFNGLSFINKSHSLKLKSKPKDQKNFHNY